MRGAWLRLFATNRLSCRPARLEKVRSKPFPADECPLDRVNDIETSLAILRGFAEDVAAGESGYPTDMVEALKWATAVLSMTAGLTATKVIPPIFKALTLERRCQLQAGRDDSPALLREHGAPDPRSHSGGISSVGAWAGSRLTFRHELVLNPSNSCGRPVLKSSKAGLRSRSCPNVRPDPSSHSSTESCQPLYVDVQDVRARYVGC